MKVNRIINQIVHWNYFLFFWSTVVFSVPAAPMRNSLLCMWCFFLFHCTIKCRKLEVYLVYQPLIRVKRYTINHPWVHDR